MVCFTGELTSSIDKTLVTRNMIAEEAKKAGMIVKNGVVKKLDLLVVADPNSMSGKAKKAREYGIRIIAESEFWRKLGVQVD